MELLSQKIRSGELTIQITVHDLSYRMGMTENADIQNHLYVTLAASDKLGKRLWTTRVLSEDGKVKTYSSVSEALSDVKLRIFQTSDLSST
jgi:hypothetical protein